MPHSVIKGQASVEMLVTLGLILVFTIPILMLLLVSSQYGAENYAIQQAQASSHMLADSINDVYIQGDGASKIVLANFPGNTEDVFVSKEKEVIVRIKLGNGNNYDAVSPVFANISETPLIHTKGLLQFNITNEDGTVKLNPDGGETK